MGVINESFCDSVSVGPHRFNILGCSVRGSEDKINQDSLGYYSDGERLIIAIADGLGSAPMSQIGSKKAIESVFEVMSDWPCCNVWGCIVDRWRSMLDGSAEQYDTTCKFVYICNEEVIIGSIGDGWIGHLISGSYNEFQNRKEFTNTTKSMCSKDIMREVALVKKTLYRNSLFGLSTDGFSEDFDRNSRESFMQDAYGQLSNDPLSFSEEIQTALANWPVDTNKDDKTLVLAGMIE